MSSTISAATVPYFRFYFLSRAYFTQIYFCPTSSLAVNNNNNNIFICRAISIIILFVVQLTGPLYKTVNSISINQSINHLYSGCSRCRPPLTVTRLFPLPPSVHSNPAVPVALTVTRLFPLPPSAHSNPAVPVASLRSQ